MYTNEIYGNYDLLREIGYSRSEAQDIVGDGSQSYDGTDGYED